MTEELATVDPFAPVEGGAKTKFGKLKLFATPVVLETGASYTLKGIHDRDGNIREWRGKRMDKSSKRYHLVMHVKTNDKDGNEYEMSRDHLNSDKPYKSIVHPALLKVFGESKNFPTAAYALIKLEEVETGETFVSTQGDNIGQTVNRMTWRVVEKFKTEEAMKAAETAHFAKFKQTGNGTTESAEASADVPEGWEADAWANVKPKIKKALGAGKSPQQVAEGYKVPLAFIEAIALE